MCLTAMAAAALPASAAGATAIQLHVDLEVDPAKEKELASNFEKVFRPAISKQPGFVEVKLLKLRSVPVGKASGSWNHRLLISFQTEEQRQKWVAHDDHQRAWPAIEKTLKGAKFGALLYDLL